MAADHSAPIVQSGPGGYRAFLRFDPQIFLYRELAITGRAWPIESPAPPWWRAAAFCLVPAPRSSRCRRCRAAQTAIWRFQSAWASRDIFHEFAVDYAKKVEEMTGGRLKFDVLVAGSVVPAFQMQDSGPEFSMAVTAFATSGIASTRPRRCSAARRRSAGTRTACSPGSRRPTSISSASWNQGTRDDR